ncbi:hypothetical protein [Candidatus Chlorohelix sp.]|uniref:hypothetical protein n=1 Tax=Candidatus Chlorohelix sp. TaxID=3139201 RepID=UPI003041B010
METSTFSETLLARILFSGFFILMGGAVTVALFLKVADNFWWVFPALLVALLEIGLIYYSWYSYSTRQRVTITPQYLSVYSHKRGETKINWFEIVDVYETQNKADELREALPGLELLITYYIMLPQTTSGGKRGLLVIKAEDGRKIALRQHMIYDHNMHLLLRAIDFYTAYPDPTTEFLRSNNQN